MAANLSLAAANVTDEDGNLVGQRDDPVLIRDNVLRIGVGAHQISRPDVSMVSNPGRGVWVVRFVDASELTVHRGNAGCGSCGG